MCTQRQKLGHQRAQPQIGSSLDILDQQLGQIQVQNKFVLANRYNFRQTWSQMDPKGHQIDFRTWWARVSNTSETTFVSQMGFGCSGHACPSHPESLFDPNVLPDVVDMRVQHVRNHICDPNGISDVVSMTFVSDFVGLWMLLSISNRR